MNIDNNGYLSAGANGGISAKTTKTPWRKAAKQNATIQGGESVAPELNKDLMPEQTVKSLDQTITGVANEVVFNAHQCSGHLSAVGDAIYVIGGKWKLRIIVALKQGNKRFNDLQRAVKGISARVLSTELKDLELNGFVSRHVYPYTPVTVEYLLTEYTETLEPVLLALGEWGHRHREKVMADSRNEKEANAS